MCALMHAEELTVGEIARRLELAQPTVSAHVAVLRNSGLLREHHQGRTTRYRLDAARLDTLLGEMRALVVDREN
jgi:DNA-binding transcriptional ArsR family regulator